MRGRRIEGQFSDGISKVEKNAVGNTNSKNDRSDENLRVEKGEEA